ncbi:hypothetical protein [Aliivibrio fischeri]|uniref:hypothetical protein n=1 Tax=Aliivibrio fischeri TaxID=668 RepID=UPI001F25522F|nr:hypothetical protein [Aliivibrio fischeri]
MRCLKRIGNIAIGISAPRGLGYVGLLIGANSAMDNIYQACKVDSSGDCGKTTAREVVRFVDGAVGGIKAVSGIALVISVTASVPALTVAALVVQLR